MKFIVFLFFIVFSSAVNAQSIVLGTKFNVAGKDCAVDNTPKTLILEIQLGNDYVQVIKIKSTDCAHFYKLKKYTGKFRVKIEAEGYQTGVLDFEITKNTKDTLILNPVTLNQKKLFKYKDVTVTGTSNDFIKSDAEKTVVSVSANDLFSIGTTYDAILKMPGVLLSPNGSLLLNGKPTAIWFDGQPSDLSGQDLINLLNSLPARLIEKIEIISNPGAAYDANVSGGIVNIITTAKAIKGFSGTVSGNYFANQTIKSGLSTSLRGRFKKFGWSITTGYNNNASLERKNISSIFPDSILKPAVQYFQSSKISAKPFFLRFGINYTFSKTASLFLRYNLNNSTNKVSTSSFINTENLSPFFSGNTYSHPTEANKLQDFSINYQKKLDAQGRELNISTNWSNYSKYNFNPTIQAISTPQFTNLHLYDISNIEQQIKSKTIKADFVLPNLKYGISMQTGIKFHHIHLQTIGQYNLHSTISDLETNPSYNTKSQYKYIEWGSAVYGELKKSIGKLNISTGVRLEQFRIENIIDKTPVVKSNFYVFPNASLLYKLNPLLDASFTYARKIDQPGYAELDPNLNGYHDSYTSVKGNPFLSTNFFNNYSFKFTAFKYASIGANYSYAKNENFLVAENTGNYTTVQTYKSFNRVRNANYSIALPIPFGVFTKGVRFFSQKINVDNTNFLYLVTGINSYHIKNKGAYVEQFKSSFSLGGFAQIILAKDMKLNLTYSYGSKGTYQIYNITSPIQKLDATISKAFFNKNLKVTFGVMDVFNAYKLSAITNAPGLNTNYALKTNSQNFNISIQYKFGKFSFLSKANEAETEINNKRIEKKASIQN